MAPPPRCTGCSLDYCAVICFPVNVLWDKLRDGPSAWALATLVGDSGAVSRSWLQPGPHLIDSHSRITTADE